MSNDPIFGSLSFPLDIGMYTGAVGNNSIILYKRQKRADGIDEELVEISRRHQVDGTTTNIAAVVRVVEVMGGVFRLW